MLRTKTEPLICRMSEMVQATK